MSGCGHRGQRLLGIGLLVLRGAPVAFLPDQFRLPVLGRGCRKGNSSEGPACWHCGARVSPRLKAWGLVRPPPPPSGGGTHAQKGLSRCPLGPPPGLQRAGRAGAPEARGRRCPRPAPTAPARGTARTWWPPLCWLFREPPCGAQDVFLSLLGTLAASCCREVGTVCLLRRAGLRALLGRLPSLGRGRPSFPRLRPALCLGPCFLLALARAPGLGGEL